MNNHQKKDGGKGSGTDRAGLAGSPNIKGKEKKSNLPVVETWLMTFVLLPKVPRSAHHHKMLSHAFLHSRFQARNISGKECLFLLKASEKNQTKPCHGCRRENAEIWGATIKEREVGKR